MRLINANELPVSSIDAVDVDKYIAKYGAGIPVVLLSDIEHAHTIEERKTGKWINLEVAPFANNDGQLIYEKLCNQCGTIAYFRSIGNDCIGNNFCPNCGARLV